MRADCRYLRNFSFYRTETYKNKVFAIAFKQFLYRFHFDEKMKLSKYLGLYSNGNVCHFYLQNVTIVCIVFKHTLTQNFPFCLAESSNRSNRNFSLEVLYRAYG